MAITHGKTHTPEYGRWRGMWRRVTHPEYYTHPKYHPDGYYKNVKICPEWRNFENFLDDMGKLPSPLHTLDRYPDGNGDYTPENCRWATRKEQANNRPNMVKIYVKVGSHIKSIPQLSKETGIKEFTIRWRRMKGWAEEDLSKPFRIRRMVSKPPASASRAKHNNENQNNLPSLDGVGGKTLAQLSRESGIPYGILYRRLKIICEWTGNRDRYGDASPKKIRIE